MPSLGADMTEGTVLEWLVKPGDTVRRGDRIAVVDTVKAAIDVESFEEGEVERLLVEPGATVPVGAPMAVLRAPGAVPPQRPVTRPSPRPSPVARHREKVREQDGERVARNRSDSGWVRATPLARRRADALGVPVAALRGSGPDGAVVAADVVAQPRVAEQAEAPDRRSAMQAATAALMARSSREIPHYYLQDSIDLGPAAGWLAERNAGQPVEERLVMSALLHAAVAQAASHHTDFNGFMGEGGYEPASQVDLGVAVSLRRGGLVVAALRDAERMSLVEVMQAMKGVAERARSGRLRSSELSVPTITVTNLGDRGVDLVHGVIYPPQVALVGFGRVDDRPQVVSHEVVARPSVIVTLAADHRVSDGHRGSLLLADIEELLQDPEAL